MANVTALSIAQFEAALKSAPGPTPWYLHKAGWTVSTPMGELRWCPVHNSWTALRDARDVTYAMIGSYCYVQAIDPTRFVVWSQDWNGSTAADVVLRMVDATHLCALDAAAFSAQDISQIGGRVQVDTDSIARMSLPNTFPDGLHRLEIPPNMQGIDELLLLVTRSNDTVIWVLHPGEGILEVIPQDWFNASNPDLGYQWVTRIARRPDTGQLLGEGIRLGRFVLDASGRQVAEWVSADKFYHPEQVL